MKKFFLSNLFVSLLLVIAQPSIAQDSADIRAQAAVATHQLDINSANAEELASTLSGIGLSKAEAIIAYREQNGDFESIDELVMVRGIGDKTLEKNRQFLTVGIE